jgi:hypothetical protein
LTAYWWGIRKSARPFHLESLLEDGSDLVFFDIPRMGKDDNLAEQPDGKELDPEYHQQGTENEERTACDRAKP